MSDPSTDQADFSSAALLRMVADSLARQGLSLEPPAATGHRVGLTRKRALLGQVLERHGPVPILRAGLDIRHAPFHVLTGALTRTGRPLDLIARWQRLETYFHSRHRVRLEESTETGARLRHAALRGEPPRPEEDLLIGAVLAGLIMMTGAAPVRLWLGEREVPPAIDDGHVDPDFVTPDDCMVYRLSWGACAARGPASDQEEVTILVDALQTPMARKVGRILADDLLQRWSLAHLAGRLAMSTRSLQRRLKEEKTSLSALTAALRAHMAGRALAGSDSPVVLAGFLAGYSDAAHFAREFKKQTGLTPTEYRAVMGGGKS